MFEFRVRVAFESLSAAVNGGYLGFDLRDEDGRQVDISVATLVSVSTDYDCRVVILTFQHPTYGMKRHKGNHAWNAPAKVVFLQKAQDHL